MTTLKLIALDAEDLEVLAAHLQDAVVRVGDMAFLPREKRFAALANRFDWASAVADDGARRVDQRRRSALRFEHVLSARRTGFDPADSRRVLSLLTVQFEPASLAENPGGVVTLVFAGGAGIELAVECIEAEFKDLDAVWAAVARPSHLE